MSIIYLRNIALQGCYLASKSKKLLTSNVFGEDFNFFIESSQL